MILFSISKILKYSVYFNYLSFCKGNAGMWSSEKDQSPALHKITFSS